MTVMIVPINAARRNRLPANKTNTEHTLRIASAAPPMLATK
jgi:hypothetical protein